LLLFFCFGKKITRKASYSLFIPVPSQFRTSAQCNSTVITGYYHIQSKHSHEQYLAWMSNMLTIQDCLVIFTDPEEETTIQSMRSAAYPTIIIPRTIDTFLVSTIVSSDEWEVHEALDPERGNGHNRLLYSVWVEKTNMMKIVADINPFSSSYFVWLDIGAMRQAGYNNQVLVKRIPQEKGVLLLSVEQFTEEEKELTDGKSLVDFTHKNRIGGGTICCDRDSLERWHAAFYSTVRSYVEAGRFVGKDQSMMATTCLETDLCMLVLSGDWFRLQPWLRGDVQDDYTRLDIGNKEGGEN